MRKTISILMAHVEETFAALPGRRINVNGANFPYMALARETAGRIDPDTKKSLIRDMKRYGWVQKFFSRECTKTGGYPLLCLEKPDSETDEAYLEAMLQGLLAEAIYLALRRDIKWPRPINVARPGDRPLYAVPGKYVTLTEDMLAVRREQILRDVQHNLVKIWKAPDIQWVRNNPAYTEDGYILPEYAPCFGISRAFNYDFFLTHGIS